MTELFARLILVYQSKEHFKSTSLTVKFRSLFQSSPVGSFGIFAVRNRIFVKVTFHGVFTELLVGQLEFYFFTELLLKIRSIYFVC